MNPGLMEMLAKDRMTELQAAAVNRASRSAVRTEIDARSAVRTELDARAAPSGSGPRVRLANPQRAIGWFLVGVGLRLATPRTPTRSAR